LVGVVEGGAVGEGDYATHVVGSGLLHAGDEEADGAAESGIGLSPSVEAVGGVEAKLDTDVGGRGWGDGVLGDLDVIGGGEGAKSDNVDGGGGGFGGISLAGGGNGGVKAGSAAWAGVVAARVDRASRGDDGRAAKERRANDGPCDAGGISRGHERNGLANAHRGDWRSESKGDGGVRGAGYVDDLGGVGRVVGEGDGFRAGAGGGGDEGYRDGARAEVADRGSACVRIGEITWVAATGGDGRDSQSAGTVVRDGDHYGCAGHTLGSGWKGDRAGRKRNGRRGRWGGSGVTATTAGREKNQKQ